MKNVLIISVSDNNNLNLATKFSEAFTSEKVESRILSLPEFDLPLYTTKKEKEIGVPAEFKPIFEMLNNASAFVFLAPEYNGGIPPALTNMIAWASRSSEDWRQCFNRKPAVLGTHSGSGGTNVMASMRIQLSYIGLNVLGRQIHTHYKKELAQESLSEVVKEVKSIIQ